MSHWKQSDTVFMSEPSVHISEIFYSLSGEGITAGVPTVFVRLSGCSLRCGVTSDGRKLWCDTPYALGPNTGEKMNVSEVFARVEQFGVAETQILLSGGEPLEGEDKREFCALFSERVWKKRHNSLFSSPRIETNGREPISGLEHMVFTLDYKLPGSGMEGEMFLENFTFLRERKNSLDEIKFVVRDRKDFERSLEVIHSYQLQEMNLLFSPVEKECTGADLADWIKAAGIPNSRLSLQLHKILWGNKRGV